MNRIIVATGNQGKLGEIREILHGLPFSLTSLADHWDPVPVIPETGDTFLENARQKAAWVFERMGTWTLADDSGLEVDVLGGAPGVKSARYAGLDGNSAKNNRKLLRELDGVDFPLRTARFKCLVVLMTAADAYYSAEGVCEGRIIHIPRGNGGFGYDPLFVPEGFDRTFAEIGPLEKNAISHRGKALERLRRYLHELA
ncbi:MAG: RdgB/HAM1 family non-canonical purine NTP pyrophosphatase [Chitinispirillaceae bacterium]|nr:RdgB/HAM1 family non-canonical purine NTP pyrophosphatase [Chitinispirillaceae bacterium]